VEALGPWGGVAFVTVVMFAEMVPLFPTQPLSLASGLLFGGPKVSSPSAHVPAHMPASLCMLPVETLFMASLYRADCTTARHGAERKHSPQLSITVSALKQWKDELAIL
jgi:hypothetical protein